MECPNGCGDMEQLVSITNVFEPASDNTTEKFLQVIYERCRECRYEETIDSEVVENKVQNQRKL